MKTKIVLLGVALLKAASFALGAAPALAPSAETVVPLAVGSAAPALNLRTADGSVFDLQAAFKARPTVLVFYKAGWCGLGNRELGELHAHQSRFDELGYQIIAISQDKPADLQPTRLKHGLRYTLLSDSELQAAPAYGVAYRAAESLIKSYAEKNITLAPIPGAKSEDRWLIVPTVFLVDREGLIKWVFSSPRQNPPLEELIAAAENALK